MRTAVCAAALGLASLHARPAAQRAAAPSGEAVFNASCVSCHSGDDGRAPDREAMRGRSPQAIIDALTSGSMKYQGLALSGDQRRAVAEFITGRRVRGTVQASFIGQRLASDTNILLNGRPYHLHDDGSVHYLDDEAHAH